MLLTGYHGTTQKSAEKIIAERRLIPSISETDWLGSGIYFYPDINDAYNWRNAEAIIHCVIEVDSSAFLDFDTDSGKRLYSQMEAHICSEMDVTTYPKDAIRNQCAMMKMIWDQNPSIQVIAASFPTQPRKIKTLLDLRRRRREFCIRNNAGIKYIGLIRRGELT